MTTLPKGRTRAVLVAAVVLALLGAGWVTRYQYVGAGARVVRVNRWTGSTAILTRSVWRPISAAPLDTTDPYADLERR